MLSAQEFTYIHYGTRDGLAGSTVYDLCQDKDGFMWFATANGLSRYDGTRFINYTVNDGLSDNDVLKLFPDSKGRVWIGSFSNDVCFYYKGKIYNKQNCPWLSSISFQNAALAFCEDETGTLLISDLLSLVKVDSNNVVTCLSDNPMFKPYKGQKIFGLRNCFDGGFFIVVPGSMFKLRNDHIELFYSHGSDVSDKYFVLKYFPDGKYIETAAPDAWITYTSYRHTTIFVSTINGAWSVDTFNYKLKTHFLPGEKVSNTINDNEGNIWFSTLGEGIYRLPSLEIKSIGLPVNPKLMDNEVFCLVKSKTDILCGLGFSKIAMVDKSRVSSIIDYGSYTSSSLNNSSNNRLYSIKTMSGGAVILGFDAFLIKRENGESKIKDIISIKSIDEIDTENIVVGNFNGVYKLSAKDLEIVDTLYRSRCTKVFYKDKKIYIGTLNGLYVTDERKHLQYLGALHPSLKRRITDIQDGGDGTIWVATNDAGIIAYKNGKIVRTINEDSGLSSNICKALFVNDHYLFAGTNKGINKIDLQEITNPILKYSASDGLPSDIINTILVKDGIIYVGSSEGLTYFNENAVSHSSSCDLQLLNVNISGTDYRPSNNYSLSYKNNNISFEYVAISFKSGGDIVYHYKLAGLDTAWKTTRETNLIYQTLPSGAYKLQLYAENKFGVKSKTYEVDFSINTPFWKTWWSYAIVLMSVILFISYMFTRRNKIIQQRLIEKSNFQKQFAALEQRALQAQMNPHFIFNCLNTIQQYILTNDKEKANQYLTGFASLIRQTLYISGKKSIKVSEEVGFLADYLEMEKMRFGDSFAYEICIDESLNMDFIEMPALLLQPYVENSLRHGIRYKEDGTGKVDISFSLKENILVCQIRDNGIGRSKAATYKNMQHIEYQSKGMSLTEKRIELLNSINDNKISIEIVDLKDETGKGTGTEVIVQIPV